MKKINVLYSMLCRDFHDLVTKRIRNSIDIGNELAITELYNGHLNKFNNTYECCDAYYGQYYKYKEYIKCPAVDEDIIEKMNPYALEIIKMMDRKQSWDMMFEDRMHLYFEHIKFWDYVLDYYEINWVVFLNVPHEVFDYVIYCLCKIKNIKTSILYKSRIFKNRSLIFNDVNDVNRGLEELIVKYQIMYREQNVEDVELLPECKKVYNSYIRVAKETDSQRMLEKQSWQGKGQKEMIEYMAHMDVRHMIEKEYKTKTDGRMVAQKLSDRPIYREPYKITGCMKTRELWEYYEHLAEIPPKGEKYVLFAMHYQPEATSSPMAGGIYSNQLIAIDILSQNLPKGIMIYVKEHPSQTYVGKTKGLYKKIKRMRNVRLISCKCNQYDLIKGSIATATLTGTISVESVMLSKPCIVFGRCAYEYLEGVLPVRKNEECKRALERIVNGEIFIDEKNIKIFFKAVYEHSHSGNIGYGKYNDINNARDISRTLLDDIQQDKKME